MTQIRSMEMDVRLFALSNQDFSALWWLSHAKDQSVVMGLLVEVNCVMTRTLLMGMDALLFA